MAKTIKYAGKEIPLRKDGLPNLVHLPKAAREVVKKYAATQKKNKEEVELKGLLEMLSKMK